jgi:1-acyl-sn-glycerol-3-phosphate acyltransferase
VSGLVYGLLWVLFNGIIRVFLGFRVQGYDKFPASGGVIIAANHASYSDIPILGCAVKRRVFFLGRSNLFPNAFFSWVLRRLGWIPLKTNRLDRKAFTQALSLLNEGKAVAIFPEGSRTEDGGLQPGRPGIGYLVAESQCQVIPVYISGTFTVLPPGRVWPKRYPVSVTFGEPLSFTPIERGGRAKDYYEHVGKTVMEHIARIGGSYPPTCT